MKPTVDETLLTRWIDGDLSEAEAAALLETHPEILAEKEAAATLGNLLRQANASTPDIPYADFFNHQIKRRIANDEDVFSRETSVAAAAAADEPMVFPLFQRLRWLSAIGFVVTLGLLVGLGLRSDENSHTEVVSTYSPAEGATVTSAYDSVAGATVIRLDGVPPIPADVVIGDVPAGRLSQLHRVIYSTQSGSLGCPMSILAGEKAGDPLPEALLVQF